MFSHIMVGTNDPERSKAFYDAVLATVGVPPGHVAGQVPVAAEPQGVLGVVPPVFPEQADGPVRLYPYGQLPLLTRRRFVQVAVQHGQVESG